MRTIHHINSGNQAWENLEVSANMDGGAVHNIPLSSPTPFAHISCRSSKYSPPPFQVLNNLGADLLSVGREPEALAYLGQASLFSIHRREG